MSEETFWVACGNQGNGAPVHIWRARFSLEEEGWVHRPLCRLSKDQVRKNPRGKATLDDVAEAIFEEGSRSCRYCLETAHRIRAGIYEG